MVLRRASRRNVPVNLLLIVVSQLLLCISFIDVIETTFGCAAYAGLLVIFCGEVEQGGTWGRMTLSLVPKAIHNVNSLKAAASDDA
jgi:hypothetical protein